MDGEAAARRGRPILWAEIAFSSARRGKASGAEVAMLTWAAVYYLDAERKNRRARTRFMGRAAGSRPCDAAGLNE